MHPASTLPLTFANDRGLDERGDKGAFESLIPMLSNCFAHGDLAQLVVLSLRRNWLDAPFPLP